VTFPITLTATIEGSSGTFTQHVTLRHPLTVLLGPNGSGKTHLLRALRKTLLPHAGKKKVRFISAGRIGMFEQFRSDYDGHRGGQPRYEAASFGSKGDVARRHQIETLAGDFQTLAERADILIKIQERLRKLFNRDILIEWDGGELKITFARQDVPSKPYSSGREASGLLHLVGVLTALYDDEVGALLIDEPEVSLHPQLQAFLLHEIVKIAGEPEAGDNRKIVVLATHSTEMVQISKASDLLSLVFCYGLGTEPVQLDPNAGELQNKKLQGLVGRLGQEHKLALFAKRPLLVEGPADAIICSGLASKLEMYLEAAGSQVLPVIGKGQLPVVAKLFRLLGKEPVTLADADGVADGIELPNFYLANNPEADVKAAALGFSSAPQLAGSVYADFCKLVSSNWASISAVAEQHPYWLNRGTTDTDLAKRRAVFSVLFQVSEEELSKLDGTGAWPKMRARLQVLLGVLEQFGCFVLRKGSIESYYRKADPITSSEKPSAAAEEVEHITQAPTDAVRLIYNDIVRCIEFAGRTQRISEAESLRDLLLAVSAPALARIEADATTQDIEVLARTLIGDRSKVFGFAVTSKTLEVTIKSHILSLKGFPLTLNVGDDVIKRINSIVALNA
jgi:energy-coupling factor transporter ATP-binding protein EcfA2